TNDLLHGDANGVTRIPIDIAHEVADIAQEFVNAEAIVLDYVKAEGTKSIAEFAERMKQLGAAVQGLRKRVSRAGK
ncbi:MAG: hypothetical protein KDA92_20625, partial [Planctomycetales bacterium]|nr:hypothetical protein [Planctomycetales bacterium]